MAYRLKEKDKGIGEAVRRIADEQLGKALTSIETLDRAKAIHDVRKRCKKLRGLIRLVRPVFAAYSEENAALRDAARNISGARDTKVLQDTYDLIMAEYGDQIDRPAFAYIRRHFTDRRNAQSRDDDVAQKLSDTRECLTSVRQRAGSWSLDKDGWQAIEGGLLKTYTRAREAAEQAKARPDGEAFHELRKRIKYHWYHGRILNGIWTEMMGMRGDAAKRLSDLLGEHHDLENFVSEVHAIPSQKDDDREAEVAIALARARQKRLEEKAWPMVDRLLAQSPDQLGEHFEALYGVWKG